MITKETNEVEGEHLPYKTRTIKGSGEWSLNNILETDSDKKMEFTDDDLTHSVSINGDMEKIMNISRDYSNSVLLRNAVFLGYQEWRDDLEYFSARLKKYTDKSSSGLNPVDEYEDYPEGNRKTSVQNVKMPDSVSRFVNVFTYTFQLKHEGIVLRYLAMKGFMEFSDTPDLTKQKFEIKTEEFEEEMIKRYAMIRGLCVLEDRLREEDPDDNVEWVKENVK